MGFFGKKVNEKEKIIFEIQELKLKVHYLENQFAEFKKLNLIPKDDLILCEKIQKKNNQFSVEEIYLIIKTLNEIKIESGNSFFEKMKFEKEQKKEELKEIRNCFKCEKTLKEGEYYLVENKAACLKHLEKTEIKKQTKGENKNASEKNNLL